MSEKQLGPKSTIEEIFEFCRPDEGMRVVPVEIPAPKDKAHLMILIAGNKAEANVLMANLMSYVSDMHDVAEQKAQDESTVIIPGADT